jgi:CheY-like chemotaxis protein
MTQESGTKKKILIVDGDTFLIGVYAVKFRSKGFEVDSARESLEVLKRLRAGNLYDIVLLEVVMPTLSGIELLRTIRKENLLPRSTIVMFTNETQSFHIEQAKELKADGYIVKSTSVPSEVLESVMNIHRIKSNA